MSGLADFLLARLDEDESWWKRADLDGPNAKALLRKQLGDVMAKRQIVDVHVDAHGKNRDARWGRDMRLGTGLALRWLALVYSGHPDYREEWKP